MVGSNYPPGMGRRDMIRAGIIQPHAHDCEFHPDELEGPIIEDGAAIFKIRCNYVEGRYGEGWECGKTRHYRFEYSTLESPEGKTWELPVITEWNNFGLLDEIANQVILIEEEYYGDGETTIQVDPDEECGEVTIYYEGWKLSFEPNV